MEESQGGQPILTHGCSQTKTTTNSYMRTLANQNEPSTKKQLGHLLAREEKNAGKAAKLEETT